MNKNGNSPATKKDLAELELKLESKFDKKPGEMEARLIEQIRDSQTEILRGFEKFQTSKLFRGHN